MTVPEGFGSIEEPTSDEPASVWMRFAARLIDSILISFVMSLVFIPLFIGSIFDSVDSGSGLFMGGFSVGQILASLLSTAIMIGYFVFLESSRGQTLGKMLLGIKVVGPTGANPETEESIRRNIWLAISLIPIIGGILQFAAAIYIMVTINNSPIGQGWHDVMAGGTRVIRTR